MVSGWLTGGSHALARFTLHAMQTQRFAAAKERVPDVEVILARAFQHSAEVDLGGPTDVALDEMLPRDEEAQGGCISPYRLHSAVDRVGLDLDHRADRKGGTAHIALFDLHQTVDEGEEVRDFGPFKPASLDPEPVVLFRRLRRRTTIAATSFCQAIYSD